MMGVMAQSEFFGQNPPSTGPGESSARAGDSPEPGATRAAPLAARMRPRNLDEYAGQRHILGPGQLHRRALEADRIQSLILFGPPGSG